MTPLEKAREVKDKLKNESAEEKRQSLATRPVTASTNISQETIALLHENLTLGTQDLNLTKSLPQLRIHTATSSRNQLRDGEDPQVGQLYYTATKEAHDSVVVHILTIKRCRLPNLEHPEVLDATYLVGGVFAETFEPFIMYVKGMSYNKIWNLEEQLREYVNPRIGVPMFVIKIKVETEKDVVKQGKYKGQKKDVFKFTVLVNEEVGYVEIEPYADNIRNLKHTTLSAEDTLVDIIKRTGMTEKEYQSSRPVDELKTDVAEQVIDAKVEPQQLSEPEATEVEDVSDDVPF